MTNVPIYLVVGSPAECVSYYMVEYKLTTESGYTSAGNYTTLPITLTNLQDDVSYNVRITTFCCNGQYGTTLTLTINTTTLDKPTNFVATPGTNEITLVWDNMSVDTYVLQRALDNEFTIGVTTVYEGVYVASVLDTGLTNGVTYYYLVRSQLSGFPDSLNSESNATPA